MKFVLFLPVRRKCCFYYQQLNVPKFKTIVTWIFFNFFFFNDCLWCYLRFFFPQKLNKNLKSGANWEEHELSNRHFHQKQHTFRSLKSFCAWCKTTALLKLYFCSCLSTFLTFTERGRESTLSAFSEWIQNQSFTKMVIPVCSQFQSLWDFRFVVPRPGESLDVMCFHTPP